MPNPHIDLEDDTRLPFMTSPYRHLAEHDGDEGDEGVAADGSDDTEVDHKAALKRMQAAIPPDATELGCLEYELDHSPGLSWRIEDHFYLVPAEQPNGGWFIIRISWDDNYGRYAWCKDASGSGFASASEAAASMVKALFDSWSFSDEDEPDPGADARREFLARLERDNQR